MIGNDIVDIEEAKRMSNWQRPRFLEKIFTDKEQYLIKSSENPFILVWRFWSMKEAAYKLYIQLKPSRFYRPKSFECDIDKTHTTVKYNDFLCYVNTETTSKYIISESRLVEKPMISECLMLQNHTLQCKSKILKKVILSEVSERLNEELQPLSIKKTEFGIPSIYKNSKRLNIQLSLSHHGDYGAYAILTS